MSVKGQFEAGATMSRIAIDCKNGDIADRRWWVRFVRDLCDRIGMTPIAHSDIELIEGPLEEQGVSVVLILKESHIAVHSWTFHKAVRLTVDSCKDFDPRDVEGFIRERLNPKFIDHLQRL